jgi:hypothetical protein
VSEPVDKLRDYVKSTLANGFRRQPAEADLDDLTQESVLRIHSKSWG